MSNLVKQYYVVHQQNAKRVINSNSISQARIQQLTETNEQEQQSPDGFVSGLAAERVEIPPEPTPSELAQQLLADAQAQADQLLADAQAQAQFVLDDAQQKAQAVYEEQQRLGYEEGFRAGEEETEKRKQSLAEEKKRIEEEAARRRSELESEFRSRMEEMEADIVDALIPVFDKVFHIQYGDQREILLALIANTLMNVEVGNKIKIRTNEADKEILMEHLGDIRERAGAEVTVELLLDAQMTDGQCQIETNYGVFDCGIDTQFDNLVKAIRSLI